MSFAVLEHVRNPEVAVREIARVLRPGGIALQTIVTRDHRAFSAVDGYHPFSYRTYSHQEWEALAGRKFFQNRLLPGQWRELFRARGLEPCRYEVLEQQHLSAEMLASFHADFSQFGASELGQLDCVLVAVKQTGG